MPKIKIPPATRKACMVIPKAEKIKLPKSKNRVRIIKEIKTAFLAL